MYSRWRYILFHINIEGCCTWKWSGDDRFESTNNKSTRITEPKWPWFYTSENYLGFCPMLKNKKAGIICRDSGPSNYWSNLLVIWYQYNEK